MSERSELLRDSREFLAVRAAAVVSGFEVRNPQIAMLEAASRVIADGGTLLAEAGTGTGKTFAYLIPAILSGKRTVVSTRTINLQEQLVSKDLLMLSTVQDFRYAIAKGRGNYVCLRRFNAFRPASDDDAAEYRELLVWLGERSSGDAADGLSRLPFIWDRISSDADACKGKSCSYFRECFYFKARQLWESAQVIVTNHALLSLSAMMPEEQQLLPESEVLVIDEAHALDSVVTDQIGINLSARSMDYLLNKLLRPDQRGTYQGLLAQTPALFRDVEALRTEMGLFWTKVRSTVGNRQRIRGRFVLADSLTLLANSFDELRENVRSATLGLFSEDDEIDLKAVLVKLRGLCEEMLTFPEERDETVRWAEVEERRIALRMAPVYPSDFVRQNILAPFGASVLTSATLSAAGDFTFIRKMLGIERAEAISLPSPFRVRDQVEVEIRKGIDLRREDGITKLAEVLAVEIPRSVGGTLVLFTSRDVMKKTWDLIAGDLAAAGLNPMMQGELPNRLMLERMRESTNSVIFGLDSFWEGVDVKGDALSSLIITKLPFEVPTEPIVAARTEAIEKQGGNAFRDYSLPRAVLKFKQGFGRLIRSKTDRGRVIICDERIVTQKYGRSFLDSVY